MIATVARTVRRIAVLIGSDSDLPVQCLPGLTFLEAKAKQGIAQVVGVYTASIHRNTHAVLEIIEELVDRTDVLIVGAGWANHLTGTVDAYLRNTLQRDTPVVFGVAFEDFENTDHTHAAILGITEVPGTQVVFERFIGPGGFLLACQKAVCDELLPAFVGTTKPVVRRTLKEAIAAARRALAEISVSGNL
ncbi:AIR carboxylase family protein [Candidatus Uhrbacteria bacterium]|nr:AIR carboxylase family protein [Candidatus Uhrbacteria bacterium]